MSPTIQDFAKPQGAKMRRPEAMMKGIEYKLIAIAKEKSKFPDKTTGQDVMKTLAVYEDFGLLFYTYMPYQYDNKPDTFFIEKNKDIKDGKILRVVYYGKIGTTVELELLEPGQEINKEKLDGVKRIMLLESGCEPGPSKRLKTE